MEYIVWRVDDGDKFEVCALCSSVVLDPAQHDLWHEAINKIAGAAQKGESAWAFNQPLGGAILGKHGTYQ